MDKQLLQSLNNLSLALEEIALVLQDKKNEAESPTANALKGGDFSKQLENISIGIKSIKSDTTKILKNQETLLAISKEKKGVKTEEFESNDKKDSAIKKGVGTILLIALGVLAIGLAFKLVGKIDFLSVVSLGIAIVLIATAFEKIAALKLSIKDAAIASLTMVMMSVAITMSSWVLSLITPIGIAQGITAIFISGIFYIMSFNLEKIGSGLVAFDKFNIKPKDIILTLVGLAAAITASSWVFSLITPISPAQGITAILIAGVFSIIAFNLHKIAVGVVAFKVFNIKPKDLLITLVSIAAAITASSWVFMLINPLSFPQALTAILISAVFMIISFNLEKIAAGVVAFDKFNIKPKDLLLVLVGIAAAITASSWVLALINPIGFAQAVTALVITVLFAAMSYFLPELATGIAIVSKFVGEKKIYMIPLVMVGIATAIMLSSHILTMTADIKWTMLLKILAIGITMAILTTIFVPSLVILGKLGLTQLIKGGLAIVIVATAIMASSHILAMSANIDYDLLKKIAIMGTILAVITTVLSLPLYILGKISIGSIIKGALGIVVIATAIMVSSHILAVGNYSKHPSYEWTLGVGLSMLAFIPAVLALGIISMTGIGALAILAGAGMVLVVAGTIVATSYILAKGKYNKYPSYEWSASVGLSLAAFATGMVLLGGIIVASFGLGAVAIAAGGEAVLAVARTIVKTSFILEKGRYTGGPTKDWATGISLALGAFAPVYKMLMANQIMKLFGGGGVGPDDFTKAIKTISQGIVDAAWFFSEAEVAFNNPPPVAWADGVGKAIGAFAPVYKVLSEENGWFTKGPSVADMKNAIQTITEGIIMAANAFGDNIASFDITKVPKPEWGKGVGAAINAFAPVFKSLSSDTGWFTSGGEVIQNMYKAITYITSAIIHSGSKFSKANIKWENYPTKEWGSGVSSALKAFTPVFKALKDDAISGDIGLLYKGVTYITNAIVYSAKKFAKVTSWIAPDKDWGPNVSSATKSFLRMAYMAKTQGTAGVSKVYNIADSLTKTAGLFYKNRRYFTSSIDPTFMKNLSKNMMDYSKLAKYISSNDKISIKSLMGGDPMERTAKGMVSLAKGYDALAKSVGKFAASINSIDIDKIKSLNILIYNQNQNKKKEINSIQSSGGGPKWLDKKPKAMSMSKSEISIAKKSQKQDIESKKRLEKKLDEIVKVLKRIDKSATSLNDVLIDMSSGSISGTPDQG